LFHQYIAFPDYITTFSYFHNTLPISTSHNYHPNTQSPAPSYFTTLNSAYISKPSPSPTVLSHCYPLSLSNTATSRLSPAIHIQYTIPNCRKLLYTNHHSAKPRTHYIINCHPQNLSAHCFSYTPNCQTPTLPDVLLEPITTSSQTIPFHIISILPVFHLIHTAKTAILHCHHQPNLLKPPILPRRHTPISKQHHTSTNSPQSLPTTSTKSPITINSRTPCLLTSSATPVPLPPTARLKSKFLSSSNFSVFKI